MSIRHISAIVVVAATLTGCAPSGDLQPIPGSITYGDQPRSKLIRSPPGSIVPHQFYDQQGNRVEETYLLQADRSLKLVRRVVGQQPDR